MKDIDKIKQARDIVYNYYGIDLMNNKSRIRYFIVPRQIAHYLCKLVFLDGKKYKDRVGTLNMIGYVIGNKNHASVLSSFKVIRDQLSYDKEIQKDIEHLKPLIYGVFSDEPYVIEKEGYKIIFHLKDPDSFFK